MKKKNQNKRQKILIYVPDSVDAEKVKAGLIRLAYQIGATAPDRKTPSMSALVCAIALHDR